MRIRYNNSAGTLGSPALTSSATSITFASAPSFASLTSPDYIPLIIDPPQGASPNPAFEIVHLIGYSAGATAGVITRGQEGTTGVAHNVGAVWAQAPVLSDIVGVAPIGAIAPYSGSGDPQSNWLIANGRRISQSTYADCFAVMHHVYSPGGVDPGDGTFGIPNLTGRMPLGVGAGPALGAAGGAYQHSHGPGSLHVPGLAIPALSVPAQGVSVNGHHHPLSGYNSFAAIVFITDTFSGNPDLRIGEIPWQGGAIGVGGAGSGTNGVVVTHPPDTTGYFAGSTITNVPPALGGTTDDATASGATAGGATGGGTTGGATLDSGASGAADPPYLTLNYIVRVL